MRKSIVQKRVLCKDGIIGPDQALEGLQGVFKKKTEKDKADHILSEQYTTIETCVSATFEKRGGQYI